ncbi:MAG: radical SAM protein [Candidatus Methanoperedens sp.]|nr:radical SAM protein [Candidatus Methanoperedens sp.]
MRVLLIYPYSKQQEQNSYAAPLGIAYIAAVLERESHKVSILDYTTSIVGSKPYPEVTEEFFNSFKADAVGLSVLTPHYSSFREIAEIIKSLDKDIPIIAGGPHPSALPEETLSETFVDIVVRGEGEKTMSELIPALENGATLDGLAGISYKKGGRIIHNISRRPVEDINKLPFPARHLLRMNDYKVANIMSSRGCPYGCVYCFKTDGSKYRMRSPESFVDEIGEMVYMYKKTFLNFYDDLFTFDRGRVLQICDLILERNLSIKFRINSRVDTVDTVMLERLREAGCVSISYGVESGDEEILRKIRKNIKIEDVKKAFQMTRDAGISTVSNFMLGFPWETKKSIENTIRLGEELFKISLENKFRGAIYSPENIYINIVTPYPGTAIWDIAKERGMLENVDFDKLHITVPNYFSIDDFKGKPIFETPDLKREDIIDYYRIMNERTVLLRHPLKKFAFRSLKMLRELGMGSVAEKMIKVYKKTTGT